MQVLIAGGDSSVDESRTYLLKYSRSKAIDKVTATDLSPVLCYRGDSSKDRLAFVAEEISSSVNPLGSQACDSVVQEIMECLLEQAHRVSPALDPFRSNSAFPHTRH